MEITSDQIAMLSDVWRRLGLDPDVQLVETDSVATFGAITITKATDGTIISTRTGTDTPGDVNLVIRDIWQRLGLDPDNPMTASANAINTGWIEQTISPTDSGVIVTRSHVPYFATPSYVDPGFLEYQE